MVAAVPADLVAGSLEGLQLIPGHVALRGDQTAGDVPGGVQIVLSEHGGGGEIVRIAIIEGEGNDGVANSLGRGGGRRQPGSAGVREQGRRGEEYEQVCMPLHDLHDSRRVKARTSRLSIVPAGRRR